MELKINMNVPSCTTAVFIYLQHASYQDDIPTRDPGTKMYYSPERLSMNSLKGGNVQDSMLSLFPDDDSGFKYVSRMVIINPAVSLALRPGEISVKLCIFLRIALIFIHHFLVYSYVYTPTNKLKGGISKFLFVLFVSKCLWSELLPQFLCCQHKPAVT